MSENKFKPSSEYFSTMIDTQNRIRESITPMIERQNRLGEIISPMIQTIADYKTNILFSNPGIDAIKSTIKTSAFDNMKFQFSFPAIEIARKLNDSLTENIANSIKSVLDRYPSFIDSLRSPAIDWLRGFDFSPIVETLRNIAIAPDLSRRYKELNEIYLRTMYETKWFPYAGWIADTSLFYEVNKIISTSRGASKNREKRIDKAILSYYTKTEIRRIKKSWWNSELDHCIRRALGQSIEAYLRGEYVLTISSLSTMWEGLIYIKANNAPSSDRKRQRMKKTKEELKELIKYNDYELIFGDYFDVFIVSNCNGVKDVVEGVPNRHSVAHSWYNKYPNKKAALNAILLTDFIINLNPIEQTEEKRK